MSVFFFFFNDTATTEIYTLSLHDALPICVLPGLDDRRGGGSRGRLPRHRPHPLPARQGRAQEASEGRTRMTERNDHDRSEEHTSELQSRSDLVCRLLLEKKKNYRVSQTQP